MTKIIYIIADDLTGANDTGVQFYKQGYEVKVLIEDLTGENFLAENRVKKVGVIDTETRESKISDSTVKINRLFKNLKFEKEDIIYKKIDSTLRGNIGLEIELMMELTDKELCILTPSFPQNKRFTIGGHLIVNDEPLGSSEYSRRYIDPGEASYIPSIINLQTELPVGRVELKDVIKGKEEILKKVKILSNQGKKIIVLDSIKEQHLTDILAAAENLDKNILYSGSAGFANIIARRYSLTNKKFDFSLNMSPFLIINGSRNSISNQQIDYLSRNKELFIYEVDVEKILSNKKASSNFYNEIIHKYNNQDYIVIRPDPQYIDEYIINKLIQEKNISFRYLGEEIRDCLGRLAKNIIREYSIKNLFVTGGDTLLGLCKFMEINKMKIIGEIAEGIPMVEPISAEKENDLKIISKAGGFGEEATIDNVINKMLRRMKLEDE